jgi:S-disulfanyl-L-cysteine oxidoreductase SoxD
VWSGVYSEAQAERGRRVYVTHCGRCHGDNLSNPRNPLSGGPFMEHWDARTLADLYRRIRDTMPPGGAAATVEASDKLDAMAFVLQQNGFPAGSADLSADEAALGAIQIMGRTGVAPPRTGTLVRVAGCLMPRGERGWQLTNATEPERAPLPTPGSTTFAPPPSDDAAPRTVTLLNPFPNPTAHRGHRMIATGFLIRNADGDSVNVVSIEMIASSCN